MQGYGLRARGGSGFGVGGWGFRVFGFRIQVFGFRVWGLGFRVEETRAREGHLLLLGQLF